jgi:hypothetical protein
VVLRFGAFETPAEGVGAWSQRRYDASRKRAELMFKEKLVHSNVVRQNSWSVGDVVAQPGLTYGVAARFAPNIWERGAAIFIPFSH